MTDPQTKSIGEQFLNAYFAITNPNDWFGYYANDSILTFESETHIGAQNIIEKLSSIKVSYKVNVYDVQPSVNSILIFLSGYILIEGETNPMNFVRVFVLTTNQTGGYYIKNDVYKITLG